MQLNDASKFIDKLEFDNYSDWETYPEAEYTCNCGQIVAFNYRHLQKHSLSNFTNLSPEDALKVENCISKIVKTDANSFLDFYCPKCKKPVRIYFESWSGGHHGQAGFSIKFTVE